MSIFKRLRDVTVASVNNVIDSMEDPVTMLNQYIRDMEAEIGRVEIAVARQVAQEKKFRQQYEEAKELMEKRDRQVMLALSEGQDELARRALLDKKMYEARTQELEALLTTSSHAAQQMREKLAELKEEFYKMRAKKYTLMSRAQVARTQKQVNTYVTGMGAGTESAAKGFHRMEEKVMQMEAEASLSGLYQDANYDRALNELDKKDSLDQELARLKQKLAGKSDEKREELQLDNK
ncbi:PspA/IM30 family protein [Brevibacillus daliensis]|uniref:PspA/IM30 family protein n=1 Tax=Brevibacillus daliensis TaxID=2892995 RepID=UPI001E375AE9|nr:PspA/IM30 family protein [Brevibacillus daliensis]